MEVKTKLDLEQDIFYMYENKVKKEKISEIKITLISNKTLAVDFNTNILYITNSGRTVNECYSFAEKQDLLDSL